jgi:cytochrome b subunit of formate dehydrogenase
MISACILLIVIGGLVIPAIVFAALQAWSVVSLSMRIRREDDSRA